jgi:hypothetical protein
MDGAGTYTVHFIQRFARIDMSSFLWTLRKRGRYVLFGCAWHVTCHPDQEKISTAFFSLSSQATVKRADDTHEFCESSVFLVLMFTHTFCFLAKTGSSVVYSFTICKLSIPRASHSRSQVVADVYYYIYIFRH